MNFTAEFFQLFFSIRVQLRVIDCAKDDRMFFGKMTDLVVRAELIAFFKRPRNAGCDAEYFHFKMLL